MTSSNFPGSPGGQLPETVVVPEEMEHAVYRLQSYISDLNYAVNRKDSGYFLQQEVITGQQFVPTFGTTQGSNVEYRSVLRTTVDFGALPNTASKSVAHNIPGISSSYSVTKIYGAATDPAALSWIPIPYAAIVDADNIELEADATNVIITTGSDRTSYSRCFVVLEYITTT